ncbi:MULTISPECIES: hypothetical protein [unclassified Sphingomonas]|uniref:P-loop ATPase, Sll1717 family n=1 Tax=unclassified Sphingomonas TaxID=196159 RepID=UPI00226A2A0B|nr:MULTISPECIES: hypothetical protein [unclassified Sphingomonas]
MGYHAQIGTFGDVAAEEDDAILSYFLKTDAVAQVESGETIVVLGRKGSGKTALAKYFSSSTADYLSASLSLRDYPWTLHERRRNTGASEIEAYVSSWRYLIAVKTLSVLIAEKGTNLQTDSQRSAYQFLYDNYGGPNPTLSDILRPKRLKLSKTSFLPSVMGNSLGGLEFESQDGGVSPEIDALTDSLIECAHVICGQTNTKKIILGFDELDQGLASIDNQHERMVVGLILAARSFRKHSGPAKVSPVVYLRTDIWDELRFSDKNKISQSSAVLLEWDANSLLNLINERVKAKLGQDYTWTDIEDEASMRGSQPKWNHVVARTFLRPRDVIQFLNCPLHISLTRNSDADYFDNDDIQQARAPYSRYLKQELDDELGPHWEKWNEALQACSELATITFSREDFVEAYTRRKSSNNQVNADEALELLYQFSVVGYRRGIGKGGSGWVFQYSDPHAGWDNGASLLKVHLGLKEFAKLREERNN